VLHSFILCLAPRPELSSSQADRTFPRLSDDALNRSFEGLNLATTCSSPDPTSRLLHTMSSTYNGRRGPNVSQYLRDLNAVKPQDPVPEENLNFDEDLAMFTNTQFFDFDSGQTTEFQAQPAAADGSTTPSASTPDAVTSATAGIGDLSGLDFMSSRELASFLSCVLLHPVSIKIFTSFVSSVLCFFHDPSASYIPSLLPQWTEGFPYWDCRRNPSTTKASNQANSFTLSPFDRGFLPHFSRSPMGALWLS
jgi:hypothetical protein